LQAKKSLTPDDEFRSTTLELLNSEQSKLKRKLEQITATPKLEERDKRSKVSAASVAKTTQPRLAHSERKFNGMTNEQLVQELLIDPTFCLGEKV
jgi:hypothetical protein